MASSCCLWEHKPKRDNQAGLDNRVEYNCICHPGGILFKACISRKDLKSTGCSVRSGVEEVNEREIFQGSENRLIMIQTYSRRFQCVFALGNYPFDVQVPIDTLKNIIEQLHELNLIFSGNCERELYFRSAQLTWWWKALISPCWNSSQRSLSWNKMLTLLFFK